MISRLHGSNIELAELRRRFPLSLKGARLDQLIDMAQRLGFEARPLRLGLQDLNMLQTPCILHWDMNHFVVLSRADRGKVTILDPAVGRRRVRYDEASESFTGVALELSPSITFTRQSALPSGSLHQMLGNTSGLWRSLAQILLLSIVLQVFVVTAPFFTQWVVDQVLVADDRDLLLILCLGYGLVVLMQVCVGALRSWAVIHLSSRLGVQWMSNVVAHLVKLPLEFFEKRHLGDITSRLDSVQTIQSTLTVGFVEALIDGAMVIASLGMMLLYSSKLALITLLAVALYLGLRWLTFRPVRDGAERQLVAAAKQQSHLLESIRGIQSIKVAGCEYVRRSTYVNLLHDTVNREVGLARLGLGFGSVSQLMFGLERIAVVGIGAMLALQNVFSVGMLIGYLAYKDQFTQRISGLIDRWVEFRMLRLHGDRLADIVLADPEVDATFDGPIKAIKTARIAVSGLSFRYADGEPWVLRDCSFAVEDGESVAVVGPSGCGKTTLVKLMLGLLRPADGLVAIDGIDLRKMDVRSYRRLVGAVMQDDQLFAGSIAANIAFGSSGYDIESVEEAARLASIHEDIEAMPMGYHSLVGDMGAALSGGQKQRLILARALYRKPRFLFLDEATSHLDVEGERLVSDAIRELNVTRIVIAHRPETIASADRVLVLGGGRVVQDCFRQPRSSMLFET